MAIHKAALGRRRWRGISKAERSAFATEIVTKRWKRIPKSQRSELVPHNGGRKPKYPKCKRYRAHVFSPNTGRCPCGYIREEN